jgi:hypothetical protein
VPQNVKVVTIPNTNPVEKPSLNVSLSSFFVVFILGNISKFTRKHYDKQIIKEGNIKDNRTNTYNKRSNRISKRR